MIMAPGLDGTMHEISQPAVELAESEQIPYSEALQRQGDGASAAQWKRGYEDGLSDGKKLGAFGKPRAFTRPISIAMECYRRWRGRTNFIDDLDYYQLNGVVVSRPDIFLMAMAIDDPQHPGDPAWFIRMFVGDMAALVPALPPWPIKWLRFCRLRKNGTLRENSYSIRRMLHLEKLKLHRKLNQESSRLRRMATACQGKAGKEN